LKLSIRLDYYTKEVRSQTMRNDDSEPEGMGCQNLLSEVRFRPDKNLIISILILGRLTSDSL